MLKIHINDNHNNRLMNNLKNDSDYRVFIFRSLCTRKSILPLILGVIIGFCFTQLLILPSSKYPTFHEWFITQNSLKYEPNSHRHHHEQQSNSDEFILSSSSSTTTTESENIQEEESALEVSTTTTVAPQIEHLHGSWNTELADQLYREVRVLCWIMTNSTNHETRARYVKDTWGPRCNKILFMSDAVDEELGSIDLNVGYGRDVLWAKTKEAFKYIYKNHINDADWFLKADDDTYVILENLRYLLYSYKSEDPIYFGCRFKPYVDQGYMSGGAGYVLSKEAVKRFVEFGLNNNMDPEKCDNNINGDEDVEIGKCLQSVGVVAGDSRDISGRRRFFPSGPDHHAVNFYQNPEEWYWKYSYYNITEGANCCSDYAISFHYVKPSQMYFLDYAIYHMRPFGIVYQKEPLPDKIAISFSHSSTTSNLTTAKSIYAEILTSTSKTASTTTAPVAATSTSPAATFKNMQKNIITL